MADHLRLVWNSGGGVAFRHDQIGKADLAVRLANNGDHRVVASLHLTARNSANRAGGAIDAGREILEPEFLRFQVFRKRHAGRFAYDGKFVNNAFPAPRYCVPAPSAQSVLMANGLKKLRRARRWSLEKLADESGVSVSQISRIERGESMPSAESMAKICKALQCSPAHIYMTDRDLKVHRLAARIMEMSAAEQAMINRLIYGDTPQETTPEK